MQVLWPASQVGICVSGSWYVDGRGFAAHRFSSHHQSIAEHFEQKCRSADPRLSSGVPRPLSTALYILFPLSTVRDIYERQRMYERTTHEMSALPLVICSVCACAPRLTEPPVPPTLRQIEHTQSWYGTGVLDWTVKATAPQWQLPLSSTGMILEGC